MALRTRDPLIPFESLPETVNQSLIPGWVKFGGVVAGAALVLARLGGVAYADDGHHGGGSGGHRRAMAQAVPGRSSARGCCRSPTRGSRPTPSGSSMGSGAI